MGRAIKLILYYLAYQLLFIFWQPEPMPLLLLSAEQILQPTSARDNGNIHRYVTLRISHDMALGTFPLCQVQ